ncbi:MAG: VCBS repeat-containing protein [Chitinophagaceae bacterium]|nr:VCBS repeat-containing protein [Chitinophagaceae bacterium]
MRKIFFIPALWICIGLGCKKKDGQKPFFTTLDSRQTGLTFVNELKDRKDFNMLKYMYFYNGAGVGAGDFNNDGLTDLFFASNQQRNRLYLNQGNLQFRDVTDSARIPDDGGWSTGVSLADINNDGYLDIYICRVGNYEGLKSKNQLLMCKGVSPSGIPYYADEAAAYGLDFSGFSTHAAFLDYDLDGDLDMYLMNHSLRYNSTFQPRSSYEGTSDSLSKDILFRNDGNRFTDVSKQAGILQSVIGYGLGVAVSDVNLDGWPDIYIGNDFHENDYLYINRKDGTFSEELTQRILHTSQFSMGVDVADVNNDGLPEIFAADMLPSDPYILRRSLGEDAYNTFQVKLRFGYNYQYARNTLQLNRGNGYFSEAGLYAGVHATDWSWSTLFLDFDNDGKKDLFVSNGIPKRLNDIDYVNYVSNEEIQQKIRAEQMGEKEMAVINNFPEIKLPNCFFRNKGNLLFEEINHKIQNNSNTFSNGAAFADFDNDGDWDIVVNNIADPVLLYRNNAVENGNPPAVEISFQGNDKNRRAVGARVVLFSGKERMVYEKYPSKGFQSSMETPLLVSPPRNFDSALVIWPDNTYEKINFDNRRRKMNLLYKKGLPGFRFSSLLPANDTPFVFRNVTQNYGIRFLHHENPFVEFDREPLMPFMVSQEGPALSVGDVNHDGKEDFFIGSVKWEKSAVFIQQPDGSFQKSKQPELEADSTYEDVDACWDDFNGDGFTDLAVASGGNEYYGNSEFLMPRLYINDGTGKLTRKKEAFPDLRITASCIIPLDINSDGKKDLFIGGRAVPFQYGAIPESFFLLNNGKAQFTDVTQQIAPDLKKAGFVTGGCTVDIDNDKDTDLVLSLEWERITAFINQNGKWIRKPVSKGHGWWRFVKAFDADNDGDMDLLAGNEGLNSRLKASPEKPVRFYYFDADNNGKKEQIITYYVQDQEIPFAVKAELEKQIPSLKKKYLYAEDFANASLHQIFSKSKLRKAQLLFADEFANMIFINNGKGEFTPHPLPWLAQLTTYRTAEVTDLNNDMLPDLILGGNFYANNVQLGRYDADFGTALLNKGNGNFEYHPLYGTTITGQIRKILPLRIGAETLFLLARNNDSLLLLKKVR